MLVALLPFQIALAEEEKTINFYEFHDEGINKHWAYEEMEDLFYAGVMDGFADADGRIYVKPDELITRAQFVKLIVTALGLSNEGMTKTFSDVKQDEWYADAISIAASAGLVEGHNGLFYPNHPITRAEITKILVLAFEKTVPFPSTSVKVFADVDHENWAEEYIRKASSVSIVNGHGSIFSPNQFATRAEAFVMLHRALKLEQSSLPKDADLTALLRDYITRENRLVETNRFSELPALDAEYGTGFYGAGGGDPKPFDWFYPAVDEAEITIQMDDENLEFKVLEKSNTLAKVQVSGIIVSVQAKIPSQPELNEDFTSSMDNGIYYLKKNSLSGKWKIYNYQDR